MPISYEIVPIERLRRSDRREVVWLECVGDPALNAVVVFNRLNQNRKREILDRFDLWIEGSQHHPRWVHGFAWEPYRNCLVFKWKERNCGQRFYAFVCHPQPLSRPRFELCVVTNHAEKPHAQLET